MNNEFDWLEDVKLRLELVRQARLDFTWRTRGEQVIAAAMCGDNVFLVGHVLQIERDIKSF